MTSHQPMLSLLPVCGIQYRGLCSFGMFHCVISIPIIFESIVCSPFTVHHYTSNLYMVLHDFRECCGRSVRDCQDGETETL